MVEALRYRRKVAVWIPNDVTGNFHWHKTSGRNMNLRFTQFPTERNTRNISLGEKDAWFLGLMNFLHSFADNLEIWETQNSGTLRDFADMCMDCFTFTLTLYSYSYSSRNLIHGLP